LVLAISALAFARVSYDGQQVLQCSYDESHHEKFYQVTEMMDVWGCHDDVCDIRVQTAAQKQVLYNFFNGNCSVKIEDLEANVREFEELNRVARARARSNQTQPNVFPPDGWFDAYHTIEETNDFWANLVLNYNGQKSIAGDTLGLTIQNTGTTYGGRSMWGVKIVANDANLPWIYFQCQIHAREWIAGATCQWVVNNLLTQFLAGDATALGIFRSVNLAITTVVNPDGYAYSWTNDRMWRKNRWPCGVGFGVDINRNYPDHWGEGGSSNQCTSETYMGPSAGSELETKATSSFFTSLFAGGKGIFGGIDWHSYSQLVLRPYGWTQTNSPDEARQKTLGDNYAAAVRDVSGRVYTSQKSIQLYVTTGTASDWFYGAGNTNNPANSAGFTIELRPTTSVPGFELPPIEIIPTGQENYAGAVSWITGLIASPLPKRV